ncbi:MAG: hypothetical protein R3F20_10560 [Planctomycetota bacterium]
MLERASVLGPGLARETETTQRVGAREAEAVIVRGPRERGVEVSELGQRPRPPSDDVGRLRAARRGRDGHVARGSRERPHARGRSRDQQDRGQEGQEDRAARERDATGLVADRQSGDDEDAEHRGRGVLEGERDRGQETEREERTHAPDEGEAGREGASHRIPEGRGRDAEDQERRERRERRGRDAAFREDQDQLVVRMLGLASEAQAAGLVDAPRVGPGRVGAGEAAGPDAEDGTVLGDRDAVGPEVEALAHRRVPGVEGAGDPAGQRGADLTVPRLEVRAGGGPGSGAREREQEGRRGREVEPARAEERTVPPAVRDGVDEEDERGEAQGEQRRPGRGPRHVEGPESGRQETGDRDEPAAEGPLPPSRREGQADREGERQARDHEFGPEVRVPEEGRRDRGLPQPVEAERLEAAPEGLEEGLAGVPAEGPSPGIRHRVLDQADEGREQHADDGGRPQRHPDRAPLGRQARGDEPGEDGGGIEHGVGRGGGAEGVDGGEEPPGEEQEAEDQDESEPPGERGAAPTARQEGGRALGGESQGAEGEEGDPFRQRRLLEPVQAPGQAGRQGPRHEEEAREGAEQADRRRLGHGSIHRRIVPKHIPASTLRTRGPARARKRAAEGNLPQVRARAKLARSPGHPPRPGIREADDPDSEPSILMMTSEGARPRKGRAGRTGPSVDGTPPALPMFASLMSPFHGPMMADRLPLKPERGMVETSFVGRLVVASPGFCLLAARVAPSKICAGIAGKPKPLRCAKFTREGSVR